MILETQNVSLVLLISVSVTMRRFITVMLDDDQEYALSDIETDSYFGITNLRKREDY